MRPIDAHIAVEYIKNSDLPNHWKNALISCLLSIPTIAPPPNDPLTLEELREMDGEPVWVESFIRGLASHWAIVHGKYLSDGRFSDDMERCLLSVDKNSGYGIAWIAYRNKPEEANR